MLESSSFQKKAEKKVVKEDVKKTEEQPRTEKEIFLAKSTDEQIEELYLTVKRLAKVVKNK